MTTDEYTPPGLAFSDALGDMLKPMSDTRGKNPSLGLKILEIILMTPLYILKGFVEITDPAIMIAKAIIDISNAIALTILEAIEQGLEIAKVSMQTAVNEARINLVNLEATAATSISLLKAVKGTLPEVAGTKLGDLIIICEQNDNSTCKEGKEYLPDGSTIPIIDGLATYVLHISDPPQEVLDAMDENTMATWNDFKEQFDEIKSLQEDYAKLQITFTELEEGLIRFEREVIKAVAEARKTTRDIMESPFLLPGIWAAMIPSMIPYFGGLMPFPFPGGPPSTIPGMIYLALMFIDAWEELTHDNVEASKKASKEEEGDISTNKCEDEL